MEENLALPRGFASGTADRVKAVTGGVAAVLLAILFCVSGVWKLVSLYEWSQAMGQFQVPSDIKLPFTILVGVSEMLGAALIVVPRFRRWGSWIIGLLLIAFMGYIGWKYKILVGKDCSCFPLVKRTVGPAFFVADSVMFLLAVIAGVLAPKPWGLRGALVIAGAIAVFAGVSYGINANLNSGLKAPDSITVDGKPYSIEGGNIFLFFFDPECMTCFGAAQRMSKMNWKDTKVIVIPTTVPQFASGFLHDAGLQAGISLDKELLTKTFKFISPPYGVALHFGRQRAFIDKFDPDEPAKTLRSIGFIQ